MKTKHNATKYNATQNTTGKWDVRIAQPRNVRGGFRKFDPKSKTDLPFQNISTEDNARLVASVVTERGGIAGLSERV